jgi:hypothetical protein
MKCGHAGPDGAECFMDPGHKTAHYGRVAGDAVSWPNEDLGVLPVLDARGTLERVADRVQQVREAQAARADGIARAEENANEAWKQIAYEVLLRVADRGRPFTADDVWDRMDESVSTHEPSALGPVFLKASRAGRIVKTGRTCPTRYARRHRELTEWTKPRES